MTLRRLVELAARGRAFRRRLPRQFGRHSLYVSPDAALRWLKPGEDAFERNLVELAAHWVKPDMVVWDVGANVGAFAFPAAQRSGATVVAVEADPFLAGLLRRSAAHRSNADLDIKVLEAAIADRNGVAEFAIAGRGRAANGLLKGDLSTQHGATRALLTAPTLTLDTLLQQLPTPGLVKVDVEGAELLVLAGGEALLRDVRPILYIETVDTTRAEAVRILTAAGYRLYSGDEQLAHPALASDKTTNLLAVHESTVR